MLLLIQPARPACKPLYKRRIPSPFTQPYRTTQLVFPGAKTIHDSARNNGYDDSGSYYQSPAQTICQAISYQV